jgi:hypothetical protein
MQSGDTVVSGGVRALLQAFTCATARSGTGKDCEGDDWLMFTEIPANDVGSGRLVAFAGFVGSGVSPETKIVVI